MVLYNLNMFKYIIISQLADNLPGWAVRILIVPGDRASTIAAGDDVISLSWLTLRPVPKSAIMAVVILPFVVPARVGASSRRRPV